MKTMKILFLALMLGNTTVKADIIVSSMSIQSTDHEMIGSLLDAGGGYIETVSDSFFGGRVKISQETLFMDKNGSWSGINPWNGQVFNYDDEIAAMTGNQVAVGMNWAWKDFSLHGGSMLEIFECVNGMCMGQGVPMDNGDFAGQAVSLSGTGSASVVPVPPAFWLFGSGLLGLIGISTRKKVA